LGSNAGVTSFLSGAKVPVVTDAAANPTELPGGLDAAKPAPLETPADNDAAKASGELPPQTPPGADSGATSAPPAATVAMPVGMHDARAAASVSASGNTSKPVGPHAKARGKEPADAADLGGPSATSAADTATVRTSSTNPQAGVDLSVQSMAGEPSVVSQKSEREVAKPGDKGAVVVSDESAAALQPAFVISPLAADSSAGDRHRGSFADSDNDRPEGDDSLAGGVQATSFAQTTAGASGHIVAAGQEGARSAPSPTPDRSAGSSPLPPAADASPTPPTVQTAQVLQRMDKAEIRIGLQSTDFGAIRLHTSVTNDQVGASVSTAHAGLRDALSVEAPSLEKALARHSLRLDSVSVGGGTANANSNSFGSNQRQPAQPDALNTATSWQSGRRPGARSAATPAQAAVKGSYRLDVRA
jgi:Flagellar hook-length control protein FliK